MAPGTFQRCDSSFVADEELHFIPLRSNTTFKSMDEMYHCNYLWFALLLSSSVVLILLGAISSAVSHLCHAPDMVRLCLGAHVQQR